MECQHKPKMCGSVSEVGQLVMKIDIAPGKSDKALAKLLPVLTEKVDCVPSSLLITLGELISKSNNDDT